MIQKYLPKKIYTSIYNENKKNECEVLSVKWINDTSPGLHITANGRVLPLRDNITQQSYNIILLNEFFMSIPLTKQFFCRLEAAVLFYDLYKEYYKSNVCFKSILRYIRDIDACIQRCPELGFEVQVTSAHEQSRKKRDQRYEPIANKDNVFGRTAMWKKNKHVIINTYNKTLNDF